MKKIFILIAIVTTMLLGGCAKTEKTPEVPTKEPTKESTEESTEEPSVSIHKIEHQHLQEPESLGYEIKLEEYNLGKEEYIASSGKTMPFDIRGTKAVPDKEGSFPLVVVIHGSHSNENESLRFDTGFQYLIEKLAQNGYAAVSIDVSSAYQWKYGDGDDQEKILHIASRHLELLKAENLDYDNIILIGHSRGGMAVFSLGNQVEVEGILSIAPTLPADPLNFDWPDVKTAILVPEYDGDVVSLDGYAIQSILEKRNEEFAAATLLRKANHNFFNTNISDNDSRLAWTEEELADQITKEEQQQFLANYALDFCNAVTAETDQENIWFEFDGMLPQTMYGLNVVNRIGEVDDQILLGKDQFQQAEGMNCTLTPTVDSWFFEKDAAPIDTITFGDGSYQTKDLLGIAWEQEGAGISLPITQKDFSDYDSLIVKMVVDPASELNKNDYQSFSIKLKDELGNSCQLELPTDMEALKKTKGVMDMTLVFDKEIHFFSKPSPIGVIRVNLEQIKGVDLEQISSVELFFDNEASGSVYVESVLLN